MLRLALAIGLVAAMGAAAGAQAITLTKRSAIDAAYPEGPVPVGGRLLVAEMTRDRVVSAAESGLTPFWEEEGCGPTSISPIGGSDLLVTCHLGGYLAIVSSGGVTLDRIESYADGVHVGDPNDSQADGLGGVYLSDSGIFARRAPATGALVYVSSDHVATRLVTGIHYANGVAVDPVHQQVLLSEHMGGRVLAYPVEGPGRIGAPHEALSLANLVEAVGPLGAYIGPDGIEVLDDKSFLVAIYGAATLLQVSFADGSVLAKLPVGPTFSDNVTQWNGGLAVVGAFDNTTPPFWGTIEFYDFAQ